MEITWDALFERIESDPPKHLGGFSPHLLGYYFSGYEHALSFHSQQRISGELSLWQFSRWFADKVSPGYAGVCLLLADSDAEALELFFEFRKLAKKDIATLPADDTDWIYESGSFLAFVMIANWLRKIREKQLHETD